MRSELASLAHLIQPISRWFHFIPTTPKKLPSPLQELTTTPETTIATLPVGTIVDFADFYQDGVYRLS